MDGGDAFFADELILAALEGKTKFSSADTQTGNYDQSWLSDRIFDNRTSLIIDPPDGRIPAPAPGAAERARAPSRGRARPRARRPRPGSGAQHALRQLRHAQHPRRLSELLRDHAGAGRRGAAHRDDSRRAHLPVDGGPHMSPAIRQYHGDSRARWEGDTLVIDTTNYTANATRVGRHRQAAHRSKSSGASSDDTLEYYVTFDDPTVWSTPVDADDSAQDDRRGDVRVRVPRGQLRPAGHPPRRAGAGEVVVEGRLQAARPSALRSRHHAGHLHADAVHRVAGGDVEALAVGVAEGHVGGADLLLRLAADDLAGSDIRAASRSAP